MNNRSSTTSCFELQSLYHRISLLSQNDSIMQPQLLEMLDGEKKARGVNLGFEEYEQLACSIPVAAEKNVDIFQSTDDTLQSLVQSCSCGDRSHEKTMLARGDDVGECKHHQPQQRLRNLLMTYQKNVAMDNYYYYYGKLEQEKQHPCGSGKEGINMKQKKRIRWTEELHKKFIECVNSLGGSKKATPKGVLKLMKCDGLTIFHIKSHLQKYRVTELMSEEKEGCDASNSEPVDLNTGMQIVEALRVQADVQRRLHEQLESQKKLQMRIEEQAKQLKTMIESQQNKE